MVTLSGLRVIAMCPIIDTIRVITIMTIVVNAPKGAFVLFILKMKGNSKNHESNRGLILARQSHRRRLGQRRRRVEKNHPGRT